MIRYSCCEARLGHSLDPCDCAPDYCPKCLRCDRHCDCTDQPVKVSAGPDDMREEGEGS